MDDKYKKYKSLRNDWGELNPISRIIPDKKKYSRKDKHKKGFKNYNESL